MAYRIAIVGRPNVGKSTLLNRLAGKKLAIVHDQPGVTRDWREVPVDLAGIPVVLVDTAGLEESFDDSLEARMRSGTEQAIRDADLLLFIIDAQSGLSAMDRHFADWLRELPVEKLLIANKSEARNAEDGLYEAYELGLGEPFGISAEHGIGTGELELELGRKAEASGKAGEDEDEARTDIDVTHLPDFDAATEGPLKYVFREDRPLQMSVVGRPNAGKSTLVNQLIGEDRMLTGPEAGITRDAISVSFSAEGREFRAFDTAGLRRRSKIDDSLEKMSASDSIRAVRFSEVVVLMIDAELGLDKQDLTIARHVINEGRALVLALNKWDLVKEPQQLLGDMHHRVEHSLPQIKGVPVVTISAREGRNMQRLMRAVCLAQKQWSARVSTSMLNRWFAELIADHPPPLVAGRRIKPRYISQIKTRPPTFALFGQTVKQLPASWQRYLTNGLRRDFGLEGPPVRLLLREPHNPYAKKK